MTDERAEVRTDGVWTVWETCGVILVLTLPSLFLFRVAPWRVPLDLSAQQPVFALIFALAATWRLRRRSPLGRISFGAAAMLVLSAVAYGVFDLSPDLSFSRAAVAATLGIGLSVFVARELAKDRGRLLPMAAAAVCLATATFVELANTPQLSDTPSETRNTAYYPLRIHRQSLPLGPDDVYRGGGLATEGTRVIAVTGTGRFLELTSREDGSISFERLEIEPPLDIEAFARARPLAGRTRFRVHGLSLRVRQAGTMELYASHHEWDETHGCVRLALSRHDLPAQGSDGAGQGWTRVWRSEPCLPVPGDGRGEYFAGLEAGGRMTWFDQRHLLLTIGDHQFDGWNHAMMVAQDARTDYGKTILIDLDNSQARHFTIGHRNPQGIVKTHDGRVWLTEHGPQGGDELNLLSEGANYGWPFQTTGTDYGRTYWPLQGNEPGPISFTASTFSWVPSVAVSNAIQIDSPQFSRWKDNLLVGSLAAQQLFRVVLERDHVNYIEPIPVGIRVRDLVQAPTGDIWLLGDTGVVMTVSVRTDVSTGELAFSACATCHSTDLVSGGRGPTLRGVVGARVASRRDYDYSDALERLGSQVWTSALLDEFLKNPSVVAPGSSMTYVESDSEKRQDIIKYLESLK